MHGRLVSRRIDALHQCFLVCLFDLRKCLISINFENFKPFTPEFCRARKHTYIILTPLNTIFYIVRLGFTGVYIDCG